MRSRSVATEPTACRVPSKARCRRIGAVDPLASLACLVPLCIALLLSIGGCGSGADRTSSADDSARSTVSEQELLARQLASDTVSGLAVEAVEEPAIKETSDEAAEASRAELRALADALIMPVTGVAPAELVGSFDDARGRRRHEALDIPVPRGTPVVSAAGGRLMKLHTSEFGGLMVYAAEERERFILLYAHLDRYAEGLVEGMPLRKGQLLGYVGTTGNAPPNVPHLHFGIARVADVEEWWKGTPVDPLPLLVDTSAGVGGRAQ